MTTDVGQVSENLCDAFYFTRFNFCIDPNALDFIQSSNQYLTAEMAEVKENINALFDPTGNGLEPDLLGVLESILRIHSISAQELFFKWESYCLKMGSEDTKLDLETARMFQKDVQDGVERTYQGRNTQRGSERKPAVNATPRAVTNGDVFGMYVKFTACFVVY